MNKNKSKSKGKIYKTLFLFLKESVKTLRTLVFWYKHSLKRLNFPHTLNTDQTKNFLLTKNLFHVQTDTLTFGDELGKSFEVNKVSTQESNGK